MGSHDHGHRPPSPAGEHRARGPRTVRCFALTISDTKTPDDDTSGELIRRLTQAAGHEVVGGRIVKDDPAQIRAAVLEAIAAGAQAVITSGGTGLTSRDSTFEVVSALIERPIPGFGELFRWLSFQEVGSAAMISRATAGVVQGAVVFALPGSPNGVQLALERLVLPELSHVLEQLGR
ncbi:MAG: molybdenum cofactor biosynthesis protein MoaB [Planctomycetota bacterium]|nr:molybdenum cofactor biosynthesis protein MoaB [Planctomycetota bacterium]